MAESARTSHVEVLKAEDMLKSMDLKKDQTRDPKYDENKPEETTKDQPTKVVSHADTKHEEKEKPDTRSEKESPDVKKPPRRGKEEEELEQPSGDAAQHKNKEDLGRKADASQSLRKSEKTGEEEEVPVSMKDEPSKGEPESATKKLSAVPKADQQDKQDVAWKPATTKGEQTVDVSSPASTGQGQEEAQAVDKSSTADTPVEENIGEASKVPSTEEKGGSAEKKTGSKGEGEDNLSPDVMEGKWKLTKTENYDEYLRAAGINIISRNVAPLENWQVEFKKLADNGWKVITTTTLNSGEWEFKFDEETEEVTLDGRKCMTTMSWDHGVLTQKRAGEDGDKGGVVTRKFQGDIMELVAKVDDVACVRIYERESENEA